MPRLLPKFYKIAAYIIFGMYIFSATSKILYHKETIELMTAIVQNDWLGFACFIIIILIEMALGLVLLFKQFWPIAGFFSAALLVCFTLTAFAAKWAGRITECGCFGDVIGAQVGAVFLVRNMVFLLLSLFIGLYPGIQRKDYLEDV